MEQIQRMQEHLLLIRRSIGWTAEMLGEQIGVTRQTINNIEGKRSKLTKTQYLAMRSIFDAEIACFPAETEMLHLLLTVLVDYPENFTEQQRQELINKGNLLSPSILAGSAPREAVSKEFIRTVSAAAAVSLRPIPTGLYGPIAGTWLDHALQSANRKTSKNDCSLPG